jgi:opacity protein-like surface antigen
MRGTVRAMAATGLLLVLAAGGVAGQTRVVLGVGGGALQPTKGANSFGGTESGQELKAKLGYHFQFMIGIAPNKSKVSFRVDAQYGGLHYGKLTSGVTPKDKIFAVNADIVLHPSNGGGVRPYILAGPTYGHFSYRNGLTGTAGADETTNGAGFNGGAGLNFGNGDKIWFFLEGRYIYTKEHKYIPITLGIRVNTGQPYTKGK